MAVSRRNLPLNALRAFEVAGRHCHLGRAAEELGVTHGAVSRQVRHLEQALAVELFDRSHNRLTLTAAGRRLQATVGDALNRITEGTLYLDPESVAGTLVVAATPSISTGWLLATIRDFSRKYPEIELRLVNIEPWQKELPADVSVAICFGEPDEPQRLLRELFRERYFPVCSPGLLAAGEPVNRAIDLLAYPLIHDQHGRWQRWLSRQSLDASLAPQNLYLQDSFQVLSAAREGCGIGLADRIEVANDLRSGNLVALSEETVEASQSHYLVTDQPQRMTVRARLFADYILRELEIGGMAVER
jgi:LysR family glycine cleavage system transcriptional activator